MAQTPTKKLTVLVLMGGPGSEREVSLASGGEVVKALQAGGHHVLQSDIAPDQLGALDNGDIDVVFPALHGPFGEGGQLQQILEERNIPFVGSDSASSTLAMDKHRSKLRFTQVGLTNPPAVLYDGDQAQDSLEKSAGFNPGWQPQAQLGDGKTNVTRNLAYLDPVEKSLDQTIAAVGLPAVIKPNCQGSSIGVLFAENRQQLLTAIRQSLQTHGDALVEKKISGRELTVGILANHVLPVMEIKSATTFYDYQAKYELDTTQYLFDLDLADEAIRQIQNDALRAFKLLGCRDFGRVDFMLDAGGTAYLLEVNTIPGLTSHSLLPKAALQLRINMVQMCDQIVRIAYQRPI